MRFRVRSNWPSPVLGGVRLKRAKAKMQKYCRGAVDQRAFAWRRYAYLGQGPAMRALLFSAATLVAACNVNDAKQTPASRAELAPVALGTARAALISNFQLEVTGDTYLRLNAANENEGSLDTLSVQPGAVKNRTLLFFDEQAIKNSVGTGTLQSARVDLIVASNAGGWSGNRLLGIHALRQASSESGATWLCATDTDLANSSPDCSGASAWNMNATNGT